MIREAEPVEESSSVDENFRNSSRVYVEGSRPDLRVPMREVSLSDSLDGEGAEVPTPLKNFRVKQWGM